MNILLSLDGVLSSDTGHPVRAGVALYYALTALHRVAIVTSRDTKDAEHWLASHGIIDYDDLVDSSYGLEGEDLRKRQITQSRIKSPIEMYIDADPAMCAWAFEQGITSVVFAHPAYIPVRNRPDAPTQPKAWDEVEAAIKRVNIAKSVERRYNQETGWQ